MVVAYTRKVEKTRVGKEKKVRYVQVADEDSQEYERYKCVETKKVSEEEVVGEKDYRGNSNNADADFEFGYTSSCCIWLIKLDAIFRIPRLICSLP